MAFPTGWLRKCIITVPGAQISGSNVNFPVLLTQDNFPIEMMDDGLNSALNGGGDVRFSEDAAGLTRLPCEIVSFVTGGTPSAEIHVKLPTLNAGADKTFYVWYKKAAETQPLVTDPYGRNAVWAGYAFVSHDGGVTESTTGVAMVDDGSGAVATGPWGGSALTAPRQRVSDASVADLTTAFTLQNWINGAGNATYLSRRDGSTRQFQSGYWSGTIFLNTTGADTVPLMYKPVAGWEKIDIVINTPADVDFYANGVFEGNSNRISMTSRPTIPLRVGYRGNGGPGTVGWPYAGLIGECRVVNGILSSDWLTTEHNNQSAPAAFATAGVPEAVGGGVSLIINDAITGHMADQVVTGHFQLLALDNGLNDQTAGQVAFGQTQSLTVNEAIHTHLSDQPTLSPGQIFAPNNILHDVARDLTALLHWQSLIIFGASHGLTSDQAGMPGGTGFAINPDRTYRAMEANRASSPAGGNRITQPTHNRTLRI